MRASVISIELCSRGYLTRYLSENLLHWPSDHGHSNNCREWHEIPFLSNKMIMVIFLEVNHMQEIRSFNKETMMHTDEVHVACPCCKNKRLFDADPMTEGIIKIKCPICKSVIAVSFHHKSICTERIAV